MAPRRFVVVIYGYRCLTEIAPVAEGNGWRIGCFADPFGHQWEVGKPLTESPYDAVPRIWTIRTQTSLWTTATPPYLRNKERLP